MDKFSRNWTESPPGKLKFQKNIRLSCPGFAKKVEEFHVSVDFSQTTVPDMTVGYQSLMHDLY